MRAKVKITVIDTGQEYLLLVAKMNVKGILVNTSQTILPNTQLMLELKLDEQSSILLKGYVHKISDESANKRGMVIAFSNPNDEAKKKIQRFITDSKEISMEIKSEETDEKKKNRWSLRKKDKEPESKKTEEKKSKPSKVIEQNKTLIVGDADLPSMALSSPDNQKKISIATMDEESLHAKNPGMSGQTQHAMMDPKNMVKKKKEKKPFRPTTIYRAFGFVVLIIVGVLAAGPILKFMDKHFGTKIVAPTQSTSNATKPVESDTTTTTPADANNVLESVQVEDQGSFLKISLIGKGNFASNKISKQASPNRIHIELLEISAFTAKPSMSVNNNPLTKVNVAKENSSTTIDLICAGTTPPNFEAKVYPNGMDIFIYR